MPATRSNQDQRPALPTCAWACAVIHSPHNTEELPLTRVARAALLPRTCKHNAPGVKRSSQLWIIRAGPSLNLEDVLMVTGRGLPVPDITHLLWQLHASTDALAIQHPQGNTRASALALARVRKEDRCFREQSRLGQNVSKLAIQIPKAASGCLLKPTVLNSCRRPKKALSHAHPTGRHNGKRGARVCSTTSLPTQVSSSNVAPNERFLSSAEQMGIGPWLGH